MTRSRLGTSNPLAGNPLTSALAEAQRSGPPPRTTFSLSLDVAERARDAAYFQRIPVVEIVETAIRAYVETLERERGEPFPQRPRRRKRRRSA
ncbi:MAG: hypothetical protein M3O15_16655 [Acidobacteriota bacterium]|nr:hypothetical protein [Acidobacteriota bacterium]